MRRQASLLAFPPRHRAEPVRRITDPRRLLAGYTFAPPEVLSCYCHGCYQGAILSAIHRVFGRVSACADHHPARAALALPFGQVTAAPTPAPAGPPADDPIQLAREMAALLHNLLNGPTDDPEGGTGVPRVPIPPTLSPVGTAQEIPH
jgi:hypothetical protein